MKRCPQCSFLYLDSDQLCDLDQTPLVADDFGTDVSVIEHSEEKAGKLSLTSAVHQRKLNLNLKTVSAAIVAGLIVALMLLVSYQRMRPTLKASQAPTTYQARAAQASRVSQVAQQVNELSAKAALAQQDRGPQQGNSAGVEDSESPVAPDESSPSAQQSSSTSAKTTPNPRPDAAPLRVSQNPVSTGDVTKSGRGSVTIRLADGSTLQAEEVWRTKAGIWYRRKGIVTFIKPNRVRSMNH